jgi:hypothetical protein
LRRKMARDCWANRHLSGCRKEQHDQSMWRSSGTLTGTRACFADIVSGRWFNLHISHLPTHHSPKPIHDTTYHQHGTHMMVQKQNVSKGQGFMHHEHSLLHFQSSRQSSVPRLRKPCMYGWMYGSFLY